ncbi:hypothetical protein Acr_00g0047320 [Actinidia rufa]|uniref:Uncharacterized protein n=1 Tax=Actinidia rufa TaxID=165716 RepID=A0A7J0DL84_9ERIC|nr:hypothetical protein Acr_00g0047320 [Actinidia rufa]
MRNNITRTRTKNSATYSPDPTNKDTDVAPETQGPKAQPQITPTETQTKVPTSVEGPTGDDKACRRSGKRRGSLSETWRGSIQPVGVRRATGPPIGGQASHGDAYRGSGE